MIPTLRVLTKKSKLNFTRKWKDYTVQEMLDQRKHFILVLAYFTLTSIDYTEDILIELKITDDFRLIKPSKDEAMLNDFCKAKGYKRLRNTSGGADIMKKESIVFKAKRSQRKNQGH